MALDAILGSGSAIMGIIMYSRGDVHEATFLWVLTIWFEIDYGNRSRKLDTENLLTRATITIQNRTPEITADEAYEQLIRMQIPVPAVDGDGDQLLMVLETMTRAAAQNIEVTRTKAFVQLHAQVRKELERRILG